MSPGNGLELDFGFGSLLDGSGATAGSSAGAGTGNTFASSLGDFGSSNNGNGAADYLSLSNLFDSSNGNQVQTHAHAGAPSPYAAAMQKKNLLDQQQQQLQQEQNSLNALLSQHTAAGNGAVANAPVGTVSAAGTPNPFGFATREELEALATSASAGVSASTLQHSQQSATTATANNGSNNYMFVATIVDPNQEDAPPQQMLFLPGSNQVIPMPSSATAGGSGISPMMALANLPVVFPQGTTGASNAGSNSNTLSLPSSADVTGMQQFQHQQQQQGLLSLNGFSGLGNLEDAFSSAQQVLAPAPIDFSSLGQLASVEQGGQTQSLHHLSAAPTLAPSTASAVANNASNNKAAMPVRPLSAYNFFFSDERERILQNKTDENDVFDNAKKQRLLLAHLAKDRSKRRPHRKTHGKINFTTLSKLIGSRWKQLPDERKNFYREVAAIDLERYQRELRERSPSGGDANGF